MRPACPNVITLNQYVSGALDESRAEEIAEHLAVCKRCQQRSDEMASETDGLIGAVRRGAVAAAGKDEPQLARLITEALHAGTPLNPDDAEIAAPDDGSLRPRPKRKNLETFIDGLRKSGLINEKELHRFVVTSNAEDADSFARELVEHDALTAYQARALSRGRWKGLVLGSYTIIEKLGKGGMGQVYKARHDRMGRTVCLKVLRLSGRQSPEIVERFRREIKTHSALSHPNFVVAHDADAADGIQFLVMEFIDGRDLSRRVKEDGPPPVSEALKIMRQTATALEYAHDQGVTHRDIKPHNLLVAESGDEAGQVKVLDMGLARFEPLLDGPTDSTTRASMTASGVIMGTVDYMSPEQALNSRNADARSDIYSLGCTMYFLLTGTTMFAGETLMEKIIAHREQPLPNLREKVPEVSAGLDAVFQKMVARNPNDRYQTMQELGQDLDACIASRRPSALAAPWTDLVEHIKAKPALFSIPAAATLLAGLAVHAALTDHPPPTGTTSSTEASSDHAESLPDKSTENFIGAFGGIPEALAGDNRRSKPVTEYRSENQPGWTRELPKRVAIVVADRSYSQTELNSTRDQLKKQGFESVIVSSRKGKLHSRSDRSNKKGSVDANVQVSEMNSEDYFSIVLMTGDATDQFQGDTPVGKQLQQQLRKTLAMHGSIIGIGPAQSIVTDESISGHSDYKDLNGLRIGTPKNSAGTVIKVADSKLIPKMASQLNAQFKEVEKKLGNR
jgi:serine/threonine protein kinase